MGILIGIALFLGLIVVALAVVLGTVFANGRPTDDEPRPERVRGPQVLARLPRILTGRPLWQIGLALVVVALVINLGWRWQRWLETPERTEVAGVATYDNEIKVVACAGPWRTIDQINWEQVETSFAIPDKGNIHCNQFINQGRRLHYALRQEDGRVIEVKPLDEQTPRDKPEIMGRAGSIVKATSLTGEELILLVQY